ncbi:MAG: DUF6275 family protein [Clostridiaceae bacterium]|nr:DUF6275 family protein [Clostridiaceae bacterium]
MKDFIQKIIDIVKGHLGRTNIPDDEIFVVWSCKTLQNKKAVLSTDLVNGILFEITYNGDKDEIYVDVYKKEKNYVVK